MTKKEAAKKKKQIIDDVEEIVTSGYCTLEEIMDDILDDLCHLYKQKGKEND